MPLSLKLDRSKLVAGFAWQMSQECVLNATSPGVSPPDEELLDELIGNELLGELGAELIDEELLGELEDELVDEVLLVSSAPPQAASTRENSASMAILYIRSPQSGYKLAAITTRSFRSKMIKILYLGVCFVRNYTQLQR